ncbi:MerR family transcriptional regulator [Allostreptomyces psammosilenae]|uniref:DNA-binding transcriptional MerR regulator n=1 Tax=Allostreptomyces psammosilenae TaxID=1892865 RepID=A0A853A084_9ACTN|nr:MerR family transcriptional regulator [Allostreptomyces psammosilenae]NYI07785.1 DNA-binding transcriptional MerR regulator [Allostreptomyces psammosilenae]
MRISALAHRTGVSERLLRYYEEQGLLRPSRLPNGYREYAESDVATVRHIRALLDAGLPTAVIARLLPCAHDDGAGLVPSSCPGTLADLRRHRARVAEQLTRLDASRRSLDALLDAALRQTGTPGTDPSAG